VPESIQLVDPARIRANVENPRLIFRQAELDALEQSIAQQGILVPLTVFETASGYVLLDGERRYKCAVKLGLSRVPAIIQPEPDRVTNIMMMFAIHNARRDWDPLPTAYKLLELEKELTRRQERKPSEVELANAASLSRGEVRRLKKLLDLPQQYRDQLMLELEKPRSEQMLTVDHVLEATRGAAALLKRDVISTSDEPKLVEALIDKFRSKVVDNTVAPRMLARIARSVEREEISKESASTIAQKLIQQPDFSIEQAFTDSVESFDFEHTVEQLSERLMGNLLLHRERGYPLGDGLRARLEELDGIIHSFLKP
jgi:ParB family chromosome partitioning protein